MASVSVPPDTVDAMPLRFYLDDVPVTSPSNWRDMDQELERNPDDRSISITYATTLTFSGDAHAILAQRYQQEGHCAEVHLKVEDECDGQWTVAARGVLILSDAVWDLTQCTVEVPMVDNGVGVRIIANRRVPVTPMAPLSKNSIEITPVTPIAMVMHDPYDGTDITGARRAFDWMEAITHLIAYISDDTITVVSSWYSALPDAERIAVANGNELRVTGVTSPRFSYTWDTLFMEVATKFNLWYHAYEDGLGNSFLRIEPESTFYGSEGELQVLNIQGLTRKIDTDMIPASVVVGSPDEVRELQSGHSLPYVVMNGHSEESFHFTGVCNTSEELDLTGKWQFGNNVIEEVVLDGNDDFDKDLFLIQYDQSTSKSTQGTYLNIGTDPYLYNEALTNFNVLMRYDLPSAVGSNYNVQGDAMRAESTAASDVYPTYFHYVDGNFHESTVWHAQFDNDYTSPNFDDGDAWGNGTTPGTPVALADSRYTAAAQGFYTFSATMNWEIVSTVPRKTGSAMVGFVCTVGRRCVNLHARVFSSSDVQIGADIEMLSPSEYQVGGYSHTFNFGVSLATGDYVEVWYTLASVGFILAPLNLRCDDSYPNTAGQVEVSLRVGSTIATDVIAGGGFIEPSSTSRMEVYEFDRHMPLSDWQHAVTVPEDHIEIDAGRLTHAMNIKRNLATGECSWTLNKRP